MTSCIPNCFQQKSVKWRSLKSSSFPLDSISPGIRSTSNFSKHHSVWIRTNSVPMDSRVGAIFSCFETFFIDEKNQLSKSDSYLHLRASKDQSYSTKTCTLQICAHKICLMSTGGLTCFQIWNKCKFLRPYLLLFGFVLWPCLNCINPSRYGRQLIHLDCWFVQIYLYVYIYIYVYIIRTMSSNLCKYGGQLMCVRRWIMGTKPSAGLVERSNKLIVFGWPQNLPDIFIQQNSLFRVYKKPQ